MGPMAKSIQYIFYAVLFKDPHMSRIAPIPTWDDDNLGRSDDDPGYIISADRLDTIRQQKLYPFFDQGGNDNNGDFQLSIRDTAPMINKQLNYMLPFYGFGYNYTWLSLHG